MYFLNATFSIPDPTLKEKAVGFLLKIEVAFSLFLWFLMIITLIKFEVMGKSKINWGL